MCEYIEEGAAVWLERKRTARKAHLCTVCREFIGIGVVYLEVSSMSDGRWDRSRAHIACAAFTRDWQTDVCGQTMWTIIPEDTPHQAILEHILCGDVGAAEGASVWRDWMRARAVQP
jgi:hypothetical protein